MDDSGETKIENSRRLPAVNEMLTGVLGCKWTLHVIAQIRDGIHRPGELSRTAEGLTTKVLNERLTKLMRFGIIDRESFPEIPPRVEYRLTEFGERFLTLLDEIDRLQEEILIEETGSS